ncbi:GGDEF domain-containing protein [Vibrio sp. SM6]|uniref:diguanylate cyclase n=1 Tax=Vibrio agarilyticus TaxID=2726741 RepID=A0A7X8TSX6_9VIBR|nr:GGDEF domain-containing protein [Vibrio agarilyticus]NLS13997.1 GGDEF domain-containing protein [Vibrio agarilyticus]
MNLLLSQLKVLALSWLVLCVIPLSLYALEQFLHVPAFSSSFYINLVLALGVCAALFTFAMQSLTLSHLQHALLLLEPNPQTTVVVLDRRFRILYADPQFARQVWGRGDWLYHYPITRFVHDTTFDKAMAQHAKTSTDAPSWHGRVSLTDGEEQDHPYQAKLSQIPGLLPRSHYYLLQLTQINDQDPLTTTTVAGVDYDPTTGQLSASKFDQLLHLHTRLQSRYQSSPPDCLAICNIDAFRTLNQRHGHAIGDQILLEVARRLKVSLRDTDVLARIGGDEFAIIILHTTIEQACALLERIGDDVARSSNKLFTLSIGVCEITADQTESYQHARTALTRAQNKGRNCVSAYNYTHFKLVGKPDEQR